MAIQRSAQMWVANGGSDQFGSPVVRPLYDSPLPDRLLTKVVAEETAESERFLWVPDAETWGPGGDPAIYQPEGWTYVESDTIAPPGARVLTGDVATVRATVRAQNSAATIQTNRARLVGSVHAVNADRTVTQRLGYGYSTYEDVLGPGLAGNFGGTSFELTINLGVRRILAEGVRLMFVLGLDPSLLANGSVTGNQVTFTIQDSTHSLTWSPEGLRVYYDEELPGGAAVACDGSKTAGMERGAVGSVSASAARSLDAGRAAEASAVGFTARAATVEKGTARSYATVAPEAVLTAEKPLAAEAAGQGSRALCVYHSGGTAASGSPGLARVLDARRAKGASASVAASASRAVDVFRGFAGAAVGTADPESWRVQTSWADLPHPVVDVPLESTSLGRAFEGVVRDRFGEPWTSGATVLLVRDDVNVAVASTTSDALGAYTFVRDDDDPYTYYVVVFAEDVEAEPIQAVTERGLAPVPPA